MKCPSCHGRRTSGAFVHRTSGCGYEDVQCSTCNGEGEISEERHRWIVEGGIARSLRMELNLSVREAAARLGWRAVEISDFEMGRRDPAPWLAALRNIAGTLGR